MSGMSRGTEQIVGAVFLALMVVFLILAVTTFEGTPTVLFIIAALVFLAVGLFMMTGSGASSGGGQSQQQSVVLSDGQVITQGSALVACAHCGHRVPQGSRFCPDCGTTMGG